jgi:hypothetical protein
MSSKGSAPASVEEVSAAATASAAASTDAEPAAAVGLSQGYWVVPEAGTPFQLAQLASCIAATHSDSTAALVASASAEQVQRDLLEADDNPLDTEMGVSHAYTTPMSAHLRLNKTLDEHYACERSALGLTAEEPSWVQRKKRKSNSGSAAVASSSGADMPSAAEATPHQPAAGSNGELETAPSAAAGEPSECPASRPASEPRRKKTLPQAEVETAQMRVQRGQAPATPAMLERSTFIAFQQRDAWCQAVTRRLCEGEMPADRAMAMHLQNCGEQYNIEDDGMLVHLALSHPKRGQVLLQWVVPLALRTLVLKLCHDDATASHGGVAATHVTVFQRFYWPGMATDVRTYVTSCLGCQVNKSAQTSRFQMQPAFPKRMWQRGHIDLLDMHVKSKRGHRYALVIIESRSGFVWLFALRDKSAEAVALKLFKVFCDCGCLFEEIMSDQGGEFTAAVVTDLLKLLAIHKIRTSGYHPQSNGPAESANKRICEALRAWVNHRQTDWHDGLRALQLALRARPRAETGLSPFFCLYGREARLPIDMLRTDAERPMDLTREVEERLTQLKLAEEVVTAAFGARAQTIAKRNESVQRALRVAVGDWVLVRRPPEEGRAHKLDSHHYTGPWQVLEKAGQSGLTFTCRMMGARIKSKPVHVEHMKPFKARPAELSEPATEPTARLTAQQLAELPQSEWLERVVDRNAVGSTRRWQYKMLQRDGLLSDWIEEKTMLTFVEPWVLDTFHALYEMRHARDMPAYAARPEPSAARKRTAEQALTMFPRGSQVVRAMHGAGGSVEHVWGTIAGYMHPYWRASYDDGEWEELNAAEAQAAVEQAQALRRRAHARGDDATKPVVRYVTSPHLPADFGANHVGDTVRVYASSTGWARGRITAVEDQGRGKYKLMVMWLGETRPKPQVLRKGYYCVNRADPAAMPVEPKNQSWNLLIESARLHTAQSE